MTSLINVMKSTDFGIFILFPEDTTSIRDSEERTVRDNAIFELGMFVGHLGLERCFLLTPRGIKMHLPTDFLGVTPIVFDSQRDRAEIRATLGPACNDIHTSIKRLGGFVSKPDTNIAETVYSDRDDCVAVLQSWIGNRSADDNLKVMDFRKIDQDMKLQPGCAKLYIEIAAMYYGYITVVKGQNTIRFDQNFSSKSGF